MSDNKPWVKDSGHATESELAALVQKNPIDGCWAAFYTDRFAAGRTADGVPLSTPENLLELRVFGEAGELWLCRSRVGQPFRWRLAVDAGDYLTETQLLDIAEQDGDSMMSTSGGHYTLPADKDDALLLHEYLDYDPKRDGLCGRHPLGGLCKGGTINGKRRKPLQLCAAGHRARPHLAGRLLYRPAADRAAGLHPDH